MLQFSKATLTPLGLVSAAGGRSLVLISHRDEGLDRVDQVLDLGRHPFLVRSGAPAPP